LYSWFLLDLMVISIDIGLFLVEELSGGWRSARFLRRERYEEKIGMSRISFKQISFFSGRESFFFLNELYVF